MTKEHRYTLASNKVKKLDCPYCGAKRHWQRYIDIETGEVLPEQHGRCDNSDKCGRQVTPKDTGYAKMIWEQEQKVTGVTKVTVPKQKYFRTQPKPRFKFGRSSPVIVTRVLGILIHSSNTMLLRMSEVLCVTVKSPNRNMRSPSSVKP